MKLWNGTLYKAQWALETAPPRESSNAEMLDTHFSLDCRAALLVGLIHSGSA